jgi:hypothetical protein
MLLLKSSMGPWSGAFGYPRWIGAIQIIADFEPSPLL